MEVSGWIRFGLRAKIIIIFSLFTAAISVLVTTTIYDVTQRQFLEQLKSKLLSAVTLGAESLDEAKLSLLSASSTEALEGEKVASLESTDEYKILSAQLNKIRAIDPEVIRFVYTFVPGADQNTAYYAVDSDVLNLVSRLSAGEAVDEDEISHIGSILDLSDFEVARKVIADGIPAVDQKFVYDEVYGLNSISGYAPVVDQNGKMIAILGIDMADVDARNALRQVTVFSGIVGASVLVLSFILSFLIGSLLTRNIISLQKTVQKFGERDFGARSAVKSRDEVGLLGQSFNAMAQTIVDYQDKIALVERQKAEAELKGQLESARNIENKKYLDNIPQGLLLMDENRIISTQYSRFLMNLFQLKSSPAGTDFLDFVFPDVQAQSDDRRELQSFLDILKGNTTADADMIDTINPFKDKELQLRDGSTIVVDGRFLRLGTDDHFENIMVLFEDKTSLREAELRMSEERERYDAEIEAIAAILKNGPVLFQDFLDHAQKLVRDFQSELKTQISSDRLNHFLREFHSLKGSARSLNLPMIAKEAHGLEEFLVLARGARTGRPLDEKPLEKPLELLSVYLETVATSIERFKAFDGDPISTTPRSQLDDFLESLAAMTKDLAAQLDKKAELKAAVPRDDIPHLKELKSSIIHLIRNAVDHGIEEMYDRVAAGKPQTGVVTIEVVQEAQTMKIIVADDGRGVDFAAIKRSAVKRGLMAEGAEVATNALIQMLFEPSFSSKETSTDISGRGVGLDAVAQTVKSLGGTVRVANKVGAGTTFTLSIPLN